MLETAVLSFAALGAVGAGFTGGVLFVFSNTIMKSLRAMPGTEGARTMQQINVDVYNPVFMGGFGLTTLLSAAAACVGFLHLDAPWSIPLIIGGAVYVLGVFGITGARNVPLNNALRDADTESDAGKELWQRYLRVWTTYNTVRTWMCLVSLGGYCAVLVIA